LFVWEVFWRCVFGCWDDITLSQFVANSFPLYQLAHPNSQRCGEGLTVLLNWRLRWQVDEGKSVSGRNIFPNLNLPTAPNHNGASSNLSFRDRHIVIWVNDQSDSLKPKFRFHQCSPLAIKFGLNFAQASFVG
jgi:hypothetical protein